MSRNIIIRGKSKKNPETTRHFWDAQHSEPYGSIQKGNRGWAATHPPAIVKSVVFYFVWTFWTTGLTCVWSRP